MQTIQRSDAWQLRTFRDAMRPYVAANPRGRAQSFQEPIKRHGLAVVRQLQANGHSLADAVGLLRATFDQLRKDCQQ